MTKKWFWIYLEILRGLLFYILVSLTSLGASKYFRSSMAGPNIQGFWNAPLYIIFGSIFSLLILFSLANTFASHHWQLKKEFLSQAKEMTSRKQCASFLLKNKAFQIEILTFSVFFCLCYAISPFCEEIFLALGYLPLIKSARITIAVLIALPISLLMIFLSYLSILDWWKKLFGREEITEEKKPLLAFIGQCALRVALYCIGGVAVAFVIPMLAVLFRTMALFGASFGAFIFFLVLLCVLFLVLVLLPFWKRKKLLRKIKKLVKKQGGTVVRDRKKRQKDVWRITLQNKQIAFRCFSAPRRKSLLYFHENGLVSRCKDRILWNYIVSEQYAFEAEEGCKKILLVHPFCGHVIATAEEDIALKPMKLTFLRERKTSFKAIVAGKHYLLSGDPMMEYTIYSAKGFLRILE